MPGAPANQPCLTVLGGPMSGTQLVIEDAVDDILIGSDPSCRFCIAVPGVSPIHARIWLDAGGATVYDTHSPRGLYVNDDRVNGEAPLKNGDILWLGTPGEDAVVMIQCRLPRPAPAPAPAPQPAAPEPSEATSVTASETVTAPPEESEFYVEVAAPEPSPVEATTVLAGPPDEIAESWAPISEEAPAPRLAPEPMVPAAELRDEFEDETVSVVPARPPEPTPIPAPPPPPAKPEPTPVRAAPPPARPAAAPRPAPAPPRPAAAPAPRPAPAPAASSAKAVAIGAGVLAVLVVGGFFAWRFVGAGRPVSLVSSTPVPPPTRPTATTLPAPSVTAPPVVEAPTPAPPVEEVVTIVKSPSPQAPSPSPAPAKPSPSPKSPATPAPPATPAGPSPEELRALQTATQVAGLLGQADAAAASRHEEALRLYDEVLKLEPQNARALAGRAAAQAAAAASRKRFAAGRTSVQNAKSKGDLSGFDSADVQVADAPGRIDFEVTPASVKPGDSYAARVFFVNESKKPIKVRSLSLSTLTNGVQSGGPAAPRAREIGPGQRSLVGEVTGVWKDGTNAWSLEVVLASDHNDTYRSQLSWR